MDRLLYAVGAVRAGKSLAGKVEGIDHNLVPRRCRLLCGRDRGHERNRQEDGNIGQERQGPTAHSNDCILTQKSSYKIPGMYRGHSRVVPGPELLRSLLWGTLVPFGDLREELLIPAKGLVD